MGDAYLDGDVMNPVDRSIPCFQVESDDDYDTGLYRRVASLYSNKPQGLAWPSTYAAKSTAPPPRSTRFDDNLTAASSVRPRGPPMSTLRAAPGSPPDGKTVGAAGIPTVFIGGHALWTIVSEWGAGNFSLRAATQVLWGRQ